MSGNIYEGYVINKVNYGDYDEIITFVTKSKIIVCLSKGSRKILSKNGRNLFIGNLCEFEIFESRSNEKMSRLKKASTIKAFNWDNHPLDSYQTIILLSRSIKQPFGFFNVLQKCFNLIQDQTYNDQITTLIIIKMFIQLHGISLNVTHCVRCNNNVIKTISFAEHGMLCRHCLTPQDKVYSMEITKTIYYLFMEEYDNMMFSSDSYSLIKNSLLSLIGL